MKITAIISEYNPLHNGHVYHINKTKEITDSDAIICIMSGNYVQRGMPAIIDKWNRTKAALQCGVDLILELPVIYSLSSAEFFAFGAVSLVNSLGSIDCISFGSEAGDLDLIGQLAEVLVLEPEEYKTMLKKNLEKGFVYPKARSLALAEYLHAIHKLSDNNLYDFLNSSNNILGIEYCKSLLKLKSNVRPFTIRREGGAYNEKSLNNVFSSATSIRKYLKDTEEISGLKSHMPDKSYELLRTLKDKGYGFVFEDSMLPFIKYKHFNNKEALLKLPDASEGLHNRITKSLENTNSYDELIGSVKTKRYTYTRITRILCQYFAGFDNYDTEYLRTLPSPYCRILGFNSTGKRILKQMKANSSIPVYTKIPRDIGTMMQLDLKATETYSMLNRSVSPNSDYLISPVMID